jgi:osmoprotectant transport system permease protein
MGFLLEVVDWFRDLAHWRGTNGIPNRLVEHLTMSFSALLAAVAVALPVAVWLGHKRRFGALAINVSNVGRALPSFAILVVLSLMLGTADRPLIGNVPTFVALVALAIPPIVTNAYVGVAEVPDEIRDSAKGMGLSDVQSLRRIELPMAVPLIMAGVRTSAVQVVATAALAAVVSTGGFGRYIFDGFAVRDNVRIFAGGVLVALLAFLTEVSLSLLQSRITPAGVRPSSRLEQRLAAATTTNPPATFPPS